MMSWIAAQAALLAALVPVLSMADARKGRALAVTLKTLCSLLFVGIGLVACAGIYTPFRIWMMAALVLCMAGDVILACPGQHGFVAGLFAFLLGHVAYIAAFISRSGWMPGSLAIALALAGGIALIGFSKGARPGRTTYPVLAYLMVIALMAVLAQRQGSLIIALGAILFAFSDSILAYGRFIRPLSLQQALVLGPYYAGQALLAASLYMLE